MTFVYWANARNWTILDLEAGAIIQTIKRFGVYIFPKPFRISNIRGDLEYLDKAGEDHPQVQRCLEFLNAYQFTLQYC